MKAFGMLDPSIERNAILSMPAIFGGTTPTQTDPPATTTQTDPSSSSGDGTGTGTGGQSGADTSSAGGSADPAAQYVNDPKAIQSLLQQLSKLQGDLSKATGERDGFLQKQQEQERAQMNKEQQQAQDIQNLQNQLEQYHRVVEQMAVTNALLSQGDYQWHSPRQVLGELQDDEISVDVDLNNGQANVTGMEVAVKRIAQQCPWLLKSKTEQQQSNGSGTGKVKSSGAPPAPPTGNEGKVAKRADLIKKFPVIAQGR